MSRLLLLVTLLLYLLCIATSAREGGKGGGGKHGKRGRGDGAGEGKDEPAPAPGVVAGAGAGTAASPSTKPTGGVGASSPQASSIATSSKAPTPVGSSKAPSTAAAGSASGSKAPSTPATGSASVSKAPTPITSSSSAASKAPSGTGGASKAPSSAATLAVSSKAPSTASATTTTGRPSPIPPKTENLIVACVGDSLTAGTGSSAPPNTSYPSILQFHLLEHHRRHHQGMSTGGGVKIEAYLVKNFGVPGAMAERGFAMSYGNQSAYQQSIRANPGVVVIQLGTNDAQKANWDAARYTKDLTALVQTYQRLTSHPQIFLCVPPPLYKNDTQLKYEMQQSVVNNLVPEIVASVANKTGVVAVSVFEALGGKALSHPEYFNNPRKVPAFRDDGCHPNDLGYVVMGRTIAAAILLNERHSKGINSEVVKPGKAQLNQTSVGARPGVVSRPTLPPLWNGRVNATDRESNKQMLRDYVKVGANATRASNAKRPPAPPSKPAPPKAAPASSSSKDQASSAAKSSSSSGSSSSSSSSSSSKTIAVDLAKPSEVAAAPVASWSSWLSNIWKAIQGQSAQGSN